MVAVHIGLGSNVGQKKKNISNALRLISENGFFKIVKKSSFYITQPVGPRQPDFVNAAIKAETGLGPFEALSILKQIERTLGRRKTKRWGPRMIDLDILFYGDRIIKSAKLTIPHKEIQNRSFVLDPLCEISPRLIHPVIGQTLLKLKEKLSTK